MHLGDHLGGEHPEGDLTPTARISIDGASSQPSDSVPRPRLPHGLSAIKKHIEEADDVPLRVGMFCESDVPSIRSMMGILQVEAFAHLRSLDTTFLPCILAHTSSWLTTGIRTL